MDVTADPGVADWASFSPLLVLDTGERLRPMNNVSDGAQVQFRFALARQTREVDASFILTVGDAAVRWRCVLTPPPTRDDIIYAALQVDDVTLSPGTLTGSLLVTTTLRNAGDVPLSLSLRDDFSATQGERTVRVEHVRGYETQLNDPLTPGDTRPVRVLLSGIRSGTQPVIVTMGAQQVQVGW